MRRFVRGLLLLAVSLLLAVLPPLSQAKETGGKKKAETGAKVKAKAKAKAKAAKGKGKLAQKKQEAKPAKVGRTREKPAPVLVHAAEPVVSQASSPLVTEMRHWSNPDYTRIAVTVDREVHFEPHQLPQAGTSLSSRIYVDVAGKLGPGVKDIPIGDGLLKTARIGQFRPDTVRVVLDLDSIKDYKIFTFSNPFRIIIDVKGERREEISRSPETVLAPLSHPATTAKTEHAEPKPAPPLRTAIGKIRRIVVDAGHGGHDPGAIGAGGTREKDVVLQIALKVARRLRDELGLDVVLTRSTDVFLELQERTAIANQVGADLFVSIHANASPNRNTTGIETYYLNLAKTEKAAQLAAKENGTSLEKVSLLQAVLFDLMANYKLNDSALLAEEVQKALHRKITGSFQGGRNLGVKQGPFYVLVGATMPSILVETAFLSNEVEEERLNDPHFQDLSAEGIMEGIRGYISAVK